MKKFVIVLLVALMALTSVFAEETKVGSKVSLGVAAGIDNKVVTLVGKGDYFKTKIYHYGFTADVRCDYAFTGDLAGTAILSFDVPTSAVVKAKTDYHALYATVGEAKKTSYYLGLYLGASYNLFSVGKVSVNVSAGPEFSINLDDGKFDGFVAGAVKASYPVTDKISVDLTLRGGVAWLLNGEIVKGEDEFAVRASNNKAVLGVTYKF